MINNYPTLMRVSRVRNHMIGSEWQNDFSNLPDLMQTFFRNYDAALGRWTGTDPDAESAESMTIYQYAGNNPIMFNDPMGNYINPMANGGPPHTPGGGGGDPSVFEGSIDYGTVNGSAYWRNRTDGTGGLFNTGSDALN